LPEKLRKSPVFKSGIEHGFEVIRNATFRKRTNPYLIREFLLSADPIERSLDPGYQFRF